MQKPIFHIKGLLLIILLAVGQMAFAVNEIHKAILHNYNDSTYLILHIFSFHATGGSYEQGNLRTSGYNESEIRVINLNSKKVIARQLFDAYNYEGAMEILGGSGNKIWIYSISNKSGLHALNLYTLKKEVSQAYVYSKMKPWVGRFYQPDWNKINDYFYFNHYSGNLCVTNYKNQTYYLNTNNFTVHESDIQKADKVNYLWKVVYERLDTMDLYDEFIHINNLKQIPEHHFIEGSFIIEQNAQVQYAHYQELLIDFTSLLDNINDKLSRIRVKENSETYKKYIAKKTLLETKITDTKANLKAIENNKTPDKILLRTDDNAFYVLQRNTEKKSALIAITKVNQNKNNVKVEWKTPISNMYYNVSAVQETPEFKRYFKNNITDPSYIYIQQFNNQLLIIYLLQICIIDTQTGNITWRTLL